MLKKIMAVVAAAALAASLAACKGGGSTNNPSSTGSVNLNGKAYTEQHFDGALSAGLIATAVNSAGELVAVQQQSSQSAAITTYDATGNKKGSVNTDVTDTVSMMALGPNDTVYLLAQPATGLQTVHVLDASGKTTKTIPLAGMQVQQSQNQGGAVAAASATPAAAATASPEASAAPAATRNRTGGNGGFNMRNRISSMQVSQDGSILVAAMNSGVLVYDDTGKQVRTIGDTNSIASYMALNDKGQLVVYAMGGMGQGGGTPSLKTYDTTSGSEVTSVDITGVSSMQSLFYDKTGKRLLYMTDSAVRVLGADGKDAGVLASFSDFSLLNGARTFTGFALDSQGALYLSAYNSDSASSSGTSGGTTTAGGFGGFGGGNFGGGNMAAIFGGGSSANEIIRLGLVDASTIKARKVITMAALNGSTVLDQAISDFQIKNPDYKIELKVYNTQVQGFRRGGNNSSQFDVSSLVQALNTDLMSGKGADIIVLDSLPWYKYIDKDLLVDMGQLMTDKKVDTTQYFTNIFDACKINGKLYGIPMSFSYSVLTGKAENMPDGANPKLADFLAKAKALPQGTNAFGRQDALQTFYSYLRYSYSDLVDTANHKASFDSPEFIQAMKDFKDLIGTNTSTDNNQDFQAGQLQGNVAYNISNMSNPMTLAMQRAILGDSLKYTSVPTLSGNGSGSFTASLMIGINASSQNKDAAWSFINTMLGSDIQGSGRLGGYPVLKSAAQTIIDNMKTGESLNAGGRRMILRMGDQEIEIKPLTDADYQGITSTLPSLNRLQAIDPNIQQVLTEELPTFFSGQKSAEEVAGLIQNRVNTILNE